MSLLIRHISGSEGQVELAGNRAVVGVFYKWTLERRGESAVGEPSWVLRASLSFQKDAFLLNPRWPKRITVKTGSDSVYEVTPDPEVLPVIKDGYLTIDGVKCHRVEVPQLSKSPK